MAGALIRNAIETGAPLYNAGRLASRAAFSFQAVCSSALSVYVEEAGQVAMCARIYEDGTCRGCPPI